MIEHLQPIIGMFQKEVLMHLREERDGLKSRIRDACDSSKDDSDIEVIILGTGEYTLKKLRMTSSKYLEEIYLNAITRAISDVASMDVMNPTKVPAYITQDDRDVGVSGEIDYFMSLVSSTFNGRNEQVKKIILSRSKGTTKLIEDIVGVINREWIPQMDTDVRISANHAFNAGYYTRVSEYAPFKRWVSATDHSEMNGKVVPAKDYFEVLPFMVEGELKQVPGCKMLYPGDVSESPDRRQLVNCFCRVEPVLTGPDQIVVAPVERKTRTRKKETDIDESEPAV